MKIRFLPITITLFATAVFAQGPGMHGHHMGPMGMHDMDTPAKTDQVQSYLNLTDAQVTSLQQIRTSEAAALKPLFEQMQPLEQSMHSQMSSSNADAATVGKAMLSMKSMHEQVKAAQATFRTQALAVLTSAQKTKLAALESAISLMPTIHQAMGLNLLQMPDMHGEGGPAAE